MSRVNHYSMPRMAVICAICATEFGSSSALAGEIYSYTGPNYSLKGCTGTYVASCTSDHLTGSFYTTLSLNQLENLTSYSIPVPDIAGFMFSDGNGLHLSDVNATVSELAITTDSSGDIDWWVLSLRGTDGSFISTLSCLTNTCPGGVSGGLDFSGTSGINSGSTNFEPVGQHWSAPESTGTSTPELSGGFLVATGLMLLAGFGVIRRHLTFGVSR